MSSLEKETELVSFRRSMGNSEDLVRSAEYSTLRDELLQNKQYVFERPLLIITVAGIASVQLSGESSVVFLPLLLSIVLLSNLWFTVNRLRSNARIAAYIAAVLEPASDIKWIGWENSLRLYRIWKKTNGPEVKKQKIAKYINCEAIPDAMTFYPALWWLHVATAALSLAVSGSSLFKTSDTLSIAAFILTLMVSCVFAWFCAVPYHPKKMRDLIEVDRAVWKAVFDETK